MSDLLKLPMIADRNLREIHAGEWEGITFDNLEKLYAEDFGCWQRYIGNSRCTGGEMVTVQPGIIRLKTLWMD